MSGFLIPGRSSLTTKFFSVSCKSAAAKPVLDAARAAACLDDCSSHTARILWNSSSTARNRPLKRPG